jgi:DnaJ-class molecular chaperone
MSSTTRNSKTELKVGKKIITISQVIRDAKGSKYGYKKCPTCGGKGSELRYPYYATNMPKKVDVLCEDCRGTGRVFVVPDIAEIVKESDYH